MEPPRLSWQRRVQLSCSPAGPTGPKGAFIFLHLMPGSSKAGSYLCVWKRNRSIRPTVELPASWNQSRFLRSLGKNSREHALGLHFSAFGTLRPFMLVLCEALFHGELGATLRTLVIVVGHGTFPPFRSGLSRLAVNAFSMNYSRPALAAGNPGIPGRYIDLVRVLHLSFRVAIPTEWRQIGNQKPVRQVSLADLANSARKRCNRVWFWISDRASR